MTIPPLKCSKCRGTDIESDIDILSKVFDEKGRVIKYLMCNDCGFAWEEPVGPKMGMRERARAVMFLVTGKGK